MVSSNFGVTMVNSNPWIDVEGYIGKEGEKERGRALPYVCVRDHAHRFM